MNISTNSVRIALAAFTHRSWKALLAMSLGLQALSGSAVNLTPLPPYLAENKGAPMVMINLSKDHQLFYKAYNEYSDLNGDGKLDTQYVHSYRYYGYFDNHRCYTYSTSANRYVPTRKENTSDTYCGNDGEWHGNFLNWATMTRMDVVRRILYGGKRSTDTTIDGNDVSLTVLERAHLPSDAHSFAKYYKYDSSATPAQAPIEKITPFNRDNMGPATTEISICNTSPGNTGGAGQYSHSSSIGPPLIKVAKGNYQLWNSNERWQCYWSGEKNATNGNNAALSGVNASANNPSNTGTVSNGLTGNALGSGYAAGTYIVRVEVCKTGLEVASGTNATGFTPDEEARCKYYPLGNYKPAGLLQKYGERNEAAFGLMTGSFMKNKSGGVLRKNVSSFTDEVDLDDGQLHPVTSTGSGAGIVSQLDNLRIYGYDYGDGTYIGQDNCSFQLTSLTDGQCTSWGNPLGEVYLEALRYMAGKTANSDFTYTESGSKDAALGLTIATWRDPFASTTTPDFGDPICRQTNIINFNASVTTYDNDQWSKQSDFGGGTVPAGATKASYSFPAMDVASLTKKIGQAEALYATGALWSVGDTDQNHNTYCDAKAMTDLSQAVGICPEAPISQGGFKIAGAALWSHLYPIRTTPAFTAENTKAFHVNTYGVALATNIPRIKVRVPDADVNNPGQSKFVVILPAYRLDKGNGNQGTGTLVDFRVVTIDDANGYGKFLLQWEDSQQGGDYDQDVWGTLEYQVTTTGPSNNRTSTIAVSTKAVYQSTANPQGFGYVITGTDGKDGVHFHSGILNYSYTDPKNISVTPTTRANASGGCNVCTVNDAKTTATYTMTGVGDAVLEQPIFYASKYGGFDRDVYQTAGTTYNPGDALTRTAWDSLTTSGAQTTTGDGIPDTYFYAINPAQLEASLEQVFVTILKAGGAAPAAATSSRTSAGGYVYVSTESVKAATSTTDPDNSGEFLRYSFQADGTVSGTPDWDAGNFLTTKTNGTGWDTNRYMFTLNDDNSTGTTPNGTPKAFRWANLSTTQKLGLKQSAALQTQIDSDAIGQSRLNWIRGDSSNECVASTCLRKRVKTKLGAIINSTPWYIGPPAAGYTDAEYGGGYGNFRTSTTNKARRAVAVAANDGALHVFDAGDTTAGGTATGGSELFAYVPKAMYSTFTDAPYSKLSAMSAKDYLITSGVTRINMDGSVMAADMNLTYDGITPRTPNWRTLLFGAFGRGAKGIYSLDVTNPIVSDESDTTAAGIVRWEFNGGPDANDMGYITGRTNARNNGQPYQTGFMRNGKWAAIYGNGYNSVNGTATLFIVYADGPGSTGWTRTGTAPSYMKITVPSRSVTDVDSATSPNGLATPTAIDTNNDGVIDTIYAGDLKGNVWKFDVSAADPSAWSVSGSAPVFSATTTDTTPKKQPITTTVVPIQYPYGQGYILFFGTGKALELGDYPMATVYTNSLYGIYDPYLTTLSTQTPSYPVTTGKTGLIQQLTRTQNSVRYMTSYAVDYSTNKGWYLDLPVSSEGVIFNPFAEDQFRINVRSLAPEATSDGCRYDANSYDASLNPINGNAIANVLPNAAASTVSGYTAVGRVGKNNFEFSRGGIFKVTPPTPTTTSCEGHVGDANCKCNPADGTECVYCAPNTACNPPWTIQSNQCIYRTISALGSGGVATDVRYGSCSDGRLTWREVIRNR